MSSKLFWGLFGIIHIFLLGYLFFFTRPQQAGDIVEYYGMTVSLLNHGDVRLTDNDRIEVEKILSPLYFSDPQYYIKGVDGGRYPVHFVFYSYLLLPARIFLFFLSANPLLSFSITNFWILTVTLIVTFICYIKDNKSRIMLFLLVYFSPILSFITWPGPDLYYVSLMLISLFAFFKKEYFIAAILSSFASWHSQPLIFIPISFSLLIILQSFFQKRGINKDLVIQILLIGFLTVFPYFYNFLQFGVFTPWTIFDNFWTRTYGFGLQNIGIRKLFEQFFDPNIGLMWYAPLVFFLGIYYCVKNIKYDQRIIFLVPAFIITAFLYQTNPAWHYGTAGYGPTRHILFFLALFIYFAYKQIIKIEISFNKLLLLIFLFLWQIYTLVVNGFLSPDFRNTLKHTPFARYILDNYPAIYNPTPEIFADRTDSTDLDHPTSAFYLYKDFCRKAYVLPSDIDKLLSECGFIPKEKREYIIESLKKAKPYEGVYVNY